jgi:hypothetical protein
VTLALCIIVSWLLKKRANQVLWGSVQFESQNVNRAGNCLAQSHISSLPNINCMPKRKLEVDPHSPSVKCTWNNGLLKPMHSKIMNDKWWKLWVRGSNQSWTRTWPFWTIWGGPVQSSTKWPNLNHG